MMVSADDILNVYLNNPDERCDVLTFWKIRATDVHWASLALMARNYLVV